MLGGGLLGGRVGDCLHEVVTHTAKVLGLVITGLSIVRLYLVLGSEGISLGNGEKKYYKLNIVSECTCDESQF